jgi:hypothetical protein
MEVAQDSVQWRALVLAVLNLLYFININIYVNNFRIV